MATRVKRADTLADRMREAAEKVERVAILDVQIAAWEERRKDASFRLDEVRADSERCARAGSNLGPAPGSLRARRPPCSTGCASGKPQSSWSRNLGNCGRSSPNWEAQEAKSRRIARASGCIWQLRKCRRFRWHPRPGRTSARPSGDGREPASHAGVRPASSGPRDRTALRTNCRRSRRTGRNGMPTGMMRWAHGDR